jgi:coronin-1B/1C/6
MRLVAERDTTTRTGRVQLTKVDADQLEAAFAENAEVDDLKPLPTNLSHSRCVRLTSPIADSGPTDAMHSKVGHVLWHPTADNVLASASYDVKVRHKLCTSST